MVGGSAGLSAIEFDLPDRTTVVLKSVHMCTDEQYPEQERQLRSCLRPGMELISINNVKLIPASLQHAKRLINLTPEGKRAELKFDVSTSALVRKIYNERMPSNPFHAAFGLFCEKLKEEMEKTMIGKTTDELCLFLKTKWDKTTEKELRANLVFPCGILVHS